jgi:predicted DCC family thiol-disulfide oxidoreductase YuxK
MLDIVYDGRCGFCVRALRLVGRAARPGAFHLHDANDRAAIAARFPALKDADIEEAMFVVTGRGEVFRGFFAFRRMLRQSPRLWALLPLFYAPGASLLGPRVYAWVARNRRELGCAISG